MNTKTDQKKVVLPRLLSFGRVILKTIKSQRLQMRSPSPCRLADICCGLSYKEVGRGRTGGAVACVSSDRLSIYPLCLSLQPCISVLLTDCIDVPAYCGTRTWCLPSYPYLRQRFDGEGISHPTNSPRDRLCRLSS